MAIAELAVIIEDVLQGKREDVGVASAGLGKPALRDRGKRTIVITPFAVFQLRPHIQTVFKSFLQLVFAKYADKKPGRKPFVQLVFQIGERVYPLSLVVGWTEQHVACIVEWCS